MMKNSRLFNLSVIDPKDELDLRFQHCHSVYTSCINGLSEREIHDTLNMTVCKGAQQYEEISLGLLYTILSDPTNSNKAFRDLMLISRDGLNLVLTKINQIICEKWIKLLEPVKKQLLWLTQQLVKNSILGTDSVFFYLVRQMAGGDLSPKNVWLIETVLDIIREYEEWLIKHPFTTALVIYTYLRLMEDHTPLPFATLRQKETQFCVKILRTNFQDCMIIGRDLVRLLQNVSRIPEIDHLWQDILYRPSSLSPQFTGVMQLMSTKTPRRFPASRLTPDMEAKVVFMTSKVRFGSHRRYQEWFGRHYLATPESQTLRTDLIRFVCSVIHPTNEVLCSDVIPRWALIGWLLTTCTGPANGASAKLALFYDWLTFDPSSGGDNIMNIEPAILVIHHSMKPHPALSQGLLEFLCRTIQRFYPPATETLRSGVRASLKTILEKRVLPSLNSIFGSEGLDRDLRYLAHETLGPAFVPLDSTSSSSPTIVTITDQEDVFAGQSAKTFSGGIEGHNLPPTPPPSTNSAEEDDPCSATSAKNFKKIRMEKRTLQINSNEDRDTESDYEVNTLAIDDNTKTDVDDSIFDTMPPKSHSKKIPEYGRSNTEAKVEYDEEFKIVISPSQTLPSPFLLNLDSLNPYLARVGYESNSRKKIFLENLENLDEDLKKLFQNMYRDQEHNKRTLNAFLRTNRSAMADEKFELDPQPKEMIGAAGIGNKGKKGPTWREFSANKEEDPFYTNNGEYGNRRRKRKNKTASTPASALSSADDFEAGLEDFLAEQCTHLQAIVEYLTGPDYENEIDDDALACCLAYVLHPYFTYKAMAPDDGFNTTPSTHFSNNNNLFPTSTLFRNICTGQEQEESSSPSNDNSDDAVKLSFLLNVLAKVKTHEPCLGYWLLSQLLLSPRIYPHSDNAIFEEDDRLSRGVCYTSSINTGDAPTASFEIYKEFCKALPSPHDKLSATLITDLELCHASDPQVFVLIFPTVASTFPDLIRNHQGLVRSFVGTLSASAIASISLFSECALNNVYHNQLTSATQILHSIFRADQELADLIEDSLDWEPLEQVSLWRLLKSYFTSLTATTHYQTHSIMKAHSSNTPLITPSAINVTNSTDYTNSSISSNYKGDHHPGYSQATAPTYRNSPGSSGQHSTLQGSATNSSKKGSPAVEPTLPANFREFCLSTQLIKLPLDESMEAMYSIFSLLKSLPPDTDLIRGLLGCELKAHKEVRSNNQRHQYYTCPSLTVLLLRSWSTTSNISGSCNEELAEIMATLITNYADPRSRLKASSGSSSRKESNAGISLEQILGHLEQLRKSLFVTVNPLGGASNSPSLATSSGGRRKAAITQNSSASNTKLHQQSHSPQVSSTLFSHGLVRLALQEVKSVCSETVKSRFGELFSVVEDDNEDGGDFNDPADDYAATTSQQTTTTAKRQHTQSSPSPLPSHSNNVRKSQAEVTVQREPAITPKYYNNHNSVNTPTHASSKRSNSLNTPPTLNHNLKKSSKSIGDIYSEDDEESALVIGTPTADTNKATARTPTRYSGSQYGTTGVDSEVDATSPIRKRKRRISSFCPVLDSDSDE